MFTLSPHVIVFLPIPISRYGPDRLLRPCLNMIDHRSFPSQIPFRSRSIVTLAVHLYLLCFSSKALPKNQVENVDLFSIYQTKNVDLFSMHLLIFLKSDTYSYMSDNTGADLHFEKQK